MYQHFQLHGTIIIRLMLQLINLSHKHLLCYNLLIVT